MERWTGNNFKLDAIRILITFNKFSVEIIIIFILKHLNSSSKNFLGGGMPSDPPRGQNALHFANAVTFTPVKNMNSLAHPMLKK